MGLVDFKPAVKAIISKLILSIIEDANKKFPLEPRLAMNLLNNVITN
jgi:hypothetical protein